MRRTKFRGGVPALELVVRDLCGKLSEVEDTFNQGGGSGLNVCYSCGENVQTIIDHFKVLSGLLPEIEYILGELVDGFGELADGCGELGVRIENLLNGFLDLPQGSFKAVHPGVNAVEPFVGSHENAHLILRLF